MGTPRKLPLPVIGPYELQEEIGGGAMGRVYRALDRRSQTPVAVKALPPGAAGGDLYHLKREFRVVRGLSSPHLVPLYDLFVEDEEAYVVMPLLHGQTLAEWARVTDWRAEPTRLLAVVVGLLRGVADLHAAGVVHRDIKPTNVMVEPDGRVLVLDYGLATHEVTSEAFVTSSPGVLAGTLAYVPPDALYGGEPRPSRDAFACGVAIYEMISQRLPARSTDTWEVDVNRARQTLKESWFAAPSTLLDIVAGLLHSAPDRRMSIEEALRQLNEVGDRTHSSPLPPAAFVGRRLLRANTLERLRARGARLAVRGPSGIGKTTLCREIVTALAEEEPQLVVFRGRCHPSEHLPHPALDELVDDIARWLVRCGPSTLSSIVVPDLAALQDAFPVLRRVELGHRESPRAPRDREERRRRLAWALADLFAELARLTPVLLWIDDIHWADGNATLLAEAMATLPDGTLRLLLSGQALPNGYADLAAAVDLGPLDADACHALARERATTRGVAGDLGAVVAAAEGNPAVLCHLVDLVDPAQPEARPTLDGLVSRRLEALDTEVRRALCAASLVNEPVPARALDELAGDYPRSAVHELLALGMLRQRASGDDVAVELSHAKLRDAVRATLGEEERVTLHAALASAVEGNEQVSPELLATLWQGAGERRKAADHLVAAGHAAADALAFERAVRCFEGALTLGGASHSREVLPALALALAHAGRGRQAATRYDECAAIAPHDERPELLRRAAIQLLLAGYVDEGLARVRATFELYGMALPRHGAETIARLLTRRGWQRLRGWRYQLGATPAQPAAAIADAGFSLSTALAPVDPAFAQYVHTLVVPQALESGDALRIARAMALEAGFAGISGRDPRRAEELLSSAQVLVGDRPAPQVAALVAITKAGSAWGRGQWQHCVDAASTAEAIAVDELVGARWELSFARSVLQDALRWMGRYDELSARTASYLDDAAARGDKFARVTYRTRFGSLLELVADRPRRAWAAARNDHEWDAGGVHLQHLASLHARGDCLLYAGDTRRALRLVQDGYRRVRLSPLMTLPAPRAKLFHLLAGCSLAAARLAKGRARQRALAEARRRTAKLRGHGHSYLELLADILDATADHVRGQEVAARLSTLAFRAGELGMEQLGIALSAVRGELTGDGTGAERQHDRLRELGVKNPTRFMHVLLPGLARCPAILDVTD